MTRLLLVLFFLAAALPAHAQVGGVCNHLNTINFCVTETIDGDNATTAGLNDEFGGALAFGDFNGDGFNDLAVGVPGENTNAGAVHIYDGSRSNVRTVPLVFDQNDIAGQSSRFDERFGQTLASGDFNGDGIDDLAIGAPNENTDENVCGRGYTPCVDDGVVHVVFGRAGGVSPQNALTFDARDAGLFSAEIDHNLHFGQTLGAGDLDGDGADELVVGAPNTKPGRHGNQGAGVIIVISGDRELGLDLGGGIANRLPIPQGGDGLQEAHAGNGPLVVARIGGVAQVVVGHPDFDDPGLDNVGTTWLFHFDATRPLGDQYVFTQQLRQTSFGLAGQAKEDHFGAAVAAGDFNADGFVDLAMGAPDRDIPKPNFGSIENGGRIFIVYGAASGLNLANIQVLDQAFFPGQAIQKNDGYGATLAAGDISGDGVDDLLISAPGEGDDDVGFVYFLVGGVGERLHVATGGSPIFSGGFNFSQGAIGSTNQANDYFGSVLAVADVTGDAQAEIAIGVPLRDHTSKTNAGQVYVTRRMQIPPQ